MSTIDSLTELFKQFPGIGPRQAKRFVYFLLTKNGRFRSELAERIRELEQETASCTSCQRFFVRNGTRGSLCHTCADANRDSSFLMLVEKDVDLDNIERSGAYTGRYFVLGDSVPVLDKEPERRIRARRLLEHVEKVAKEGALKEVVFALSSTPDGDNTARFLREFLGPLVEKHGLTLSSLGRGLSTGSELEYSDADTIVHAFENRH